jgi:diguanylate cyclase (GGDEF)-like protein
MRDMPRVLVVDDHPANIVMLSELLRGLCDIRFATSGAQALEMLSRPPLPDLMLLDVTMPEMDGFEVCRRLKSDPATAGIAVIFVTVRSKPEDEALGLDLGAVDYITKPFIPAIIRTRVRTHLALQRKIALLETLAFLDGLTEVPNRRNFDQTLARAWRQGRRDQEPLSLALIDIDHFKSVNDRYGHAAGDECLKTVAQRLSDDLRRPGDTLFRLGGEEFAVLMPATPLAAAAERCERLRAAVSEAPIPLPFTTDPATVTISIGCAAAIPDGRGKPDELVSQADELLYQAKQSGRNRVVVQT